jgi:hypothetical protein
MKINFKKHVFNTKEFVKYDSILFYLADFMRRKCIDVSPPGSFELTTACFALMTFTRIPVKPDVFDKMIEKIVQKIAFAVYWDDIYDKYLQEFLRTEFFDVNAAKFASKLYTDHCSALQIKEHSDALGDKFNDWEHHLAFFAIEIRVWLQNIIDFIVEQLDVEKVHFVYHLFVTLCILCEIQELKSDWFAEDHLNYIIKQTAKCLTNLNKHTKNKIGNSEDAAIHDIVSRLIKAPSWKENFSTCLKTLMQSAPVGNNNNSGSRKKPRLENSTHDRVKVDDLPQFIRTEFVKADNDVKNHIDSIQDKFLDEVKKLFVNIVDFHTKK